ncbi:MAG: Acyl transferase [Glaciihabitans sp.]|nr:Acyl transferase [Glaciihabitans sp.]
MTHNASPPLGDQEAVAIVAMGCRYPGGVGTPADLWRLVAEGRDAISELPDDRGWPLAELSDGLSSTARGGFLDAADRFDAKFFGISPREAEGMDPQQRVLLEVAWETFERASLDRNTLADSNTGVFVGAMAQEYGPRLYEDNLEAGGYRITGSSTSVLSGRIAYYFGLRGPAITVDTACSSSLVAVHLAVQALRRGECDRALAGGVAVMSSPGMFVDFSRQGGLSKDGRCRSFSDDADGTGWAEGAGLLLLERMSDAVERGHHIQAVIRGSATNSDGASNGLTAPSKAAQQDVIRRALLDAGLSPHDVDAVEAHGTGTELGDPIEARALAAVYGAGRDPGHPLWLGSLKSNLGHTQAAAGVGGLIKTVEAMRAGLLPATLHVRQPTPHVDWAGSGLALATEARPWPKGDRPRRAGVSSFGISGANAHVVLEGVEPRSAGEAPAVAVPGPYVCVVSAPDGASVPAQAAALAEALDRMPEIASEDVCRTLRGRTLFAHRGTVIADSRADLTAGLRRLADGRKIATTPGPYASPTVLRTESRRGTAGPVFVFPGQGSQWREMGRTLMQQSEVFRAGITACADEFATLCGWQLDDVLRGEGLDRVEVVQPALFAVMISLAGLWQSVGVRPAAVIGHSQGEIAAAYVAGALTLHDACRVVALRSQALSEMAGAGGMAWIPLGAEETTRLLDSVPGASIAALNSPSDTVVAGDTSALDELLAVCEQRGIDARRIDVDYASHTAAMEPLRERLARDLADIEPVAPAIPLYSTLTGAVVDTADMDAGYWFDNLRNTVRFEPTMRKLIAKRHRTFVEASPHPVLTWAVQEILESGKVQGTVVGTLRKNSGDIAQFLSSAAVLPDSAGPVDFTSVQPQGVHIDLPTYQFDRTRYWMTAPRADSANRGERAFTTTGPTELPSGQTVVAATIDRGRYPWLGDHLVREAEWVPATAFLSVLVEVGEQVGCPVVADLTLSAPLTVPEQGPAELVVVLEPADSVGRRPLTMHSRRPAGGWIVHASGLLASRSATPAEVLHQWPPAGASAQDLSGAYETLAGRGYHYGAAFQGLRSLWTRGTELFAEVTLPETVADAAECGTAHPALLDAALHPAVLRAGSGLQVPFAWREVDLPRIAGRTLRIRVTPRGDEFALALFDERGHAAGTVGGLSLRPLPPETDDGSTLELAWEQLPDGRALAGKEWSTVEAPELAARQDFPDLELISPVPPVVVAALASTGADVLEAADQLAVAGTGLLQRWLADRRFAKSRLAVVTRGALAVADYEQVRDLAAAAVTGLVRAAQTENPGTFVLIDIDEDPASVQALSSALASDEPEVVIRAGRLYRPRLRVAVTAGMPIPADTAAWRLDVTDKGTLDNLALIPHPEAIGLLGERQVRIEVRAAGLNFRDVTVGLGLVATEKTMGSEASGVVTEVGSAVTGFAPGDRVFGMFERALGPIAVTDERMIKALPEGWSFAQAASVPIVFITAYQCLVDVAGTRAGDSVLVHTATGGVGLAAIQLARHFGAEVFATAGPGKHSILREWGIADDHMASSRSLDFAGEFRSATGGRGVDIVLNSLSGAAIDASLGLLADGGRFAEMGKTDLREVTRTEVEHPGITYRAYNILGVSEDRIGEVLDELVALFEAGALTHLPVRTWDVRQGRVPLRMLSRAQHRGKLVLTMPRSFDPRRPALITGGTGNLGAEVARHLVTAHGVRRLVLLGRRGGDAPGMAELTAELVALGAEVSVVAVDITDENALAEIVGEHLPGSVFHAAGLLSDALIGGLTPAKLQAVLRPKIVGAWHLHKLTASLDLSAFVMFSSVASVVGTAGQANYAAANAFLNALAQYRRAHGLEGAALAWGLWREATGMTGHLSATDTAVLAATGIAPMDTKHGLRLLDENLASPAALRVPMRTTFTGLQPGSRAAHLFEGLIGHDRLPVAPAAATAPARSADTSSPDDAEQLLRLVRTHAADVLGYADLDAVQPDDSFKGLGFDSLLSVDLRNRLNAATGLGLPPGAVLDNPTPRDLVNFITTGLEAA